MVGPARLQQGRGGKARRERERQALIPLRSRPSSPPCSPPRATPAEPVLHVDPDRAPPLPGAEVLRRSRGCPERHDSRHQALFGARQRHVMCAWAMCAVGDGTSACLRRGGTCLPCLSSPLARRIFRRHGLAAQEGHGGGRSQPQPRNSAATTSGCRTGGPPFAMLAVGRQLVDLLPLLLFFAVFFGFSGTPSPSPSRLSRVSTFTVFYFESTLNRVVCFELNRLL